MHLFIVIKVSLGRASDQNAMGGGNEGLGVSESPPPEFWGGPAVGGGNADEAEGQLSPLPP